MKCNSNLLRINELMTKWQLLKHDIEVKQYTVIGRLIYVGILKTFEDTPKQINPPLAYPSSLAPDYPHLCSQGRPSVSQLFQSGSLKDVLWSIPNKVCAWIYCVLCCGGSPFTNAILSPMFFKLIHWQWRSRYLYLNQTNFKKASTVWFCVRFWRYA